jgi:hypothetical protein
MNTALRVALTWFDFLSLQRVLNIIGGGFLTLSLTYRLANELGAQLPPWEPLGVLGAVLILITPVAGAGAALRTFSARNAMRLLPYGRARVLCGTTLAITLMAAVATLPVLLAHLGEPVSHPLAHANPARVFAIAWTCAALICTFSFIASASARNMLLIILVPLSVSQLLFTLRYLPAGLGDRALASGMLVVLFFTSAALVWLAFCAWYLRAGTIRPTLHLMPGSQWVSRMRATPADKALAVEPPIARTAAIRQYLLGDAMSLERSFLWVALGTLMLGLVLALFLSKEGPDVLRISMSVVGYFAMNISVMFGYVPVQRARRLWLRAGIRREDLFRVTERLGVSSGLLLVGIAATGLAVWSLIQRPDLASQILLAVPLQLTLAACLLYACLGYTGTWTLPTLLLDVALGAWLLVVMGLARPVVNVSRTSLILLAATAVLTCLLRMRARRRWSTVHWRPVPKFDRRVI